MRFITVLAGFILIVSNSFSQSEWMTRNLVNVPLKLLTHKDSIPNLVKVENGVVNHEVNSFELKEVIPQYTESSAYSKDEVTTYWLDNSQNTEVMILLSFVYNRLYKIELYTLNSYYLSNFKLSYAFHFKRKNQKNSIRTSSDSIVNYGNRIVTYGERYSEFESRGENKKLKYTYYEHLEKRYGHLILFEKAILNKMPYWCGYGRKNRNWVKVKKYLQRNT